MLSQRSLPTASRRLFLKGSAMAGLLSLSPTVARAATKKTTKKTTKKVTATTKKATATTKAASGTFSAAQEMAVTFTYTPTSQGGRIQNPYVAVFVEDPNGNLIRTVGIYVNMSGKGQRYIKDLSHWYGAELQAVALGGVDVLSTVSSATRTPGTYNLVWDGKDDAGAMVAAGSYLMCIEAAREHGPYELIREPITIDGKAFQKKIADNGELSAISLELRAR
jgi:hypothetical protein